MTALFAPLFALAALSLGACTLEDGGGSPARRAVAVAMRKDSGVARPAAERESSNAGAGRVPAPLPPLGDTLVALGSADDDDTSAVAPTAADLALLRAQLTIPVEGVSADQLHDTFSEARGTRVHEALDIPAPRGTAVLSAAPGRVLRLFTSENGGLMVYAADSTERFVLLYAHLDAYAPGLVDGAPLRRGQRIGDVGTTGNAPPNVPHLHFGIARTRDIARWWTGTPVDPRALLQP